MTTFFPTAPPSGIELLRAWLLPLGPVAAKRKPNDPLPFRMITGLPGKDDKVTHYGVYRVHTFAADMATAEDEAWSTHRRILALGPPFAPQERVTISGGRIVFADCVSTEETPHWEYYSDTIERFVAEYYIDLRFVAA